MAGFWNGSGNIVRTDGTRTGEEVWTEAKTAGIKILAADHDTHDQLMAESVQACIAKDGQNTPTANLPMGSYKHTGVGNASARTHYAAAGQIQDQGLVYCGTSGGSANAQTVTFSPAVTAYVTGLKGAFIAGYTNTSSCTLSANGLTATAIKTLNGNALKGGEITAGKYYEFIYDGTNIILTNFSSTGWISYTPTYGATGSMTWAASTTYARYQILDGAIRFEVRAAGSTGGTASTGITFTLPYAPATASDGEPFFGYITQGAELAQCTIGFTGSSTTVTARYFDSRTMNASSTTTLIMAGVYRI
jgi:hypothetical protein